MAAQLLSDVVTRRGVERRTGSDTEFGVTSGERRDGFDEDGCCGVDEFSEEVEDCPIVPVIANRKKCLKC